MFQVAQHLASTYGDKAFKVAKMATLTGKRWPVVGRRLHEEYPYLEAEVSLKFLFYLFFSVFEATGTILCPYPHFLVLAQSGKFIR